MDIAPSARRHGIDDDAMDHAIRNAIRVIDVDELTMFVGADNTGRIIEVGVLVTDTGPLVVHAMPARAKFLR